MPRQGYTLPVFACASALAALQKLKGHSKIDTVTLDLLKPPQAATIAIEQVAQIKTNIALAITRSDPGDNLDITRNTPVWAMVELRAKDGEAESIVIAGGEGIGRQSNNDNKAAIYRYAQEILHHNLQRIVGLNEQIIVTIILPEGNKLALKTSNAAFGVVAGLSLLGTTGISHPLSRPEQLAIYQQELISKAETSDCLVFCLGENGLDLAQKLGVKREKLVKTANWLGPMLVTAGIAKLSSIILFGYHGKLIKLAGGIFHTHHQVADGRREIFTAYCTQCDVPRPTLKQIFASETTEAALEVLRELGDVWVEKVYETIAATIDQRCQTYIQQHSDRTMQVGSVLFDRQRQIITLSRNAQALWSKIC